MRVAIYIRVSTLDQARDGYSLDMQERTLRKWCDDHRHRVIEVYADRGISAKDIDHRPALIRLMREAKEGKFDMVLFWALSRFSRSVSDLYETMEKFQKWNISMISYTESFDTASPMGRAMIGIVGVFAQLERELTSERVTATMEERAIQGKRTCNTILGYDKDGKDTFVINADEAEYVKFCFDEYLVRKSLSEVAALARAKGFKGKRGKAPSPYSVEVILTCPVYCGYNRFHGELYKGSHVPIVSVDTFNRVQTILRRQGKSLGRPRINEMRRVKKNVIE